MMLHFDFILYSLFYLMGIPSVTGDRWLVDSRVQVQPDDRGVEVDMADCSYEVGRADVLSGGWRAIDGWGIIELKCNLTIVGGWRWGGLMDCLGGVEVGQVDDYDRPRKGVPE